MKALKAIRPGVILPVGEKIFWWCPRTICRIIARLAQQAELRGDYSRHSPRIGMVQDLARLGALLTGIQDAGRWKDPWDARALHRGESQRGRNRHVEVQQISLKEFSDDDWLLFKERASSSDQT